MVPSAFLKLSNNEKGFIIASIMRELEEKEKAMNGARNK